VHAEDAALAQRELDRPPGVGDVIEPDAGEAPGPAVLEADRRQVSTRKAGVRTERTITFSVQDPANAGLEAPSAKVATRRSLRGLDTSYTRTPCARQNSPSSEKNPQLPM
jgi:hypothetical protein